MSVAGQWLKTVKVGSRNMFHNWLMQEIGFEEYLRNQLWDDASLVHYIMNNPDKYIWPRWLEHNGKIVEIDFSKRKKL